MNFKLIVIRTKKIEELIRFYEFLGMSFEYHKHGNGPYHYSSVLNELVFEIYPEVSEINHTTALRLGIELKDVETILEKLKSADQPIVKMPRMTKYGLVSIVEDPDGRKIEISEEGTFVETGVMKLAESFRLKNRGIVFLGHCSDNIEIGNYIEFIINGEKRIRKVVGVDRGVRTNNPNFSHGLMINSFEDEIEEINNWSPQNGIGRIFAKEKDQ
ncbi:MAG: VOC family protein [Bacteroidia bacterium]